MNAESSSKMFELLKESKSDWRGSLHKINLEVSESVIRQAIVSRSPKKGTRRGLHQALGDSSEHKKIICISGTMLWISIAPISANSAKVFTYKISAFDDKCLCLDRGLVHGCIALSDNAELLILSDREYNHCNSLYYDMTDLLICLKEQIKDLPPEPYIQQEHASTSKYFNSESPALELPWANLQFIHQ